ncbi:C45 family autoproteolytic acyltransferase/hydolase [Candidatus Lokiarchaeum ossiferum]|uniref:C45 family autoproteolytic acyltransferase/hydolase n=1 Tax=Candidatus Lokiarchaeum ossiferum TaxID=2951803 RepID=UPI00352FBE8E
MPVDSIPEFLVSGSNYEIGLKIGQRFKSEIIHTILAVNFSEIFSKYPKIRDWVLELTNQANLEMPEYMQELQGVADGINMNFDTILTYNFLHAIDFDLCSTIMIKRKHEIVLGHNEDYSLDFGEKSYLLGIELSNGTKFYSFTYPGTLPGSAFAINSHGLVFSANSMPTTPLKFAFPRILFDRKLLEMESIDQILNLFSKYSERSAPLNYNILSMRESKAINIETTWNDISIKNIEHSFFHTNHFISNKFADKSIPKFPLSSTRQRLKIARNYFLITHKQEILAKEILFHSEIHKNSSDNNTLCTVVFRIKHNIIEMRIYGSKSKKPLYFRKFPEFWNWEVN